MTAHRGPNNRWDRPVAIAAIPKLRHLIGDLVERHVGEVRELHLRDRPLAGERESERNTRDRRFGQRRIDDALLAESLAQPVRDEEHATFLSDVLTQDHDALVALHLLCEA